MALLLATSVTINTFTLHPGTTYAVDEQPRYGGTFVQAIPGDPASMATFRLNIWTNQAVMSLYNGLLTYDDNLNPIPDLAESYEMSSDGTVYTFHLVHNATFHDGVPCTSADVKFSFTVTANYNYMAKAIISEWVESIETPDNFTVVFHLKAPLAMFPYYAGDQFVQIFPKHIYEGTAILENPHNTKDPIGTGPFKWVEWVKGDHITIERNPNYFKGGKPYLDKIITRIIPDVTTMLTAYEAGQVDSVANYMPASHALRFVSMGRYIVTTKGLKGWNAAIDLLFNTDKAPWDDIKVRQAIAYAVDRQVIFTKVYAGQAQPFISIGLPENMWFGQSPNITTYEYNPDKANQILDDAGYVKGSDGIRIRATITWIASEIETGQIVEIIKEQLKKVGIELTLHPLERSAMLSWAFVEDQFDLLEFGLCFMSDPSQIQAYFNSKYIQKIPSFGNPGYRNQRVDELLDLITSELDTTKRKAYCWELQEIMDRELPSIAWGPRAYIFSASNNFANWPPGEWQAGEKLENVWSRKGHVYSPWDVAAAISNAEKQIADLKNQGVDVSKAEAKLQEARDALNNYDYTTAKLTADLAPSLRGASSAPALIPVEYMYGILGGAIAAVVILGASTIWYRRKLLKEEHKPK